jgi:AraC family L-rhamnose operon transcriptional activator RhaR
MSARAPADEDPRLPLSTTPAAGSLRRTPRGGETPPDDDDRKHIVPNAPGATLPAAAFIEDSHLLGFSPKHHPPNVWWHLHEFYELAFVIEGRGLHVTALGERSIQRGTAIFVPPGAGHAYRMCRNMTVYNCFLRAGAPDVELMWVARDARLAPFFGAHTHHAPALPLVIDLDSEDLRTCLAHLDDVRSRAPGERTAANDLGHLLLVLDLLARRLDSTSSVGTPAPLLPKVMTDFVDLVERELSHPWTLAELGARLHADPYHLSHVSRRWIGDSPIAFVNRRRAEVAAVLLTTSDDPVAVVGAMVGWDKPSTFSRAFRRVFGVSPRGYRVGRRDGHHPATTARPSGETVTAPPVTGSVMPAGSPSRLTPWSQGST